MEEEQVILSVEHLMISFSQYMGGWRQGKLPVVRDLNIKVREHEVVAIAGSSGSGKSPPVHTIMSPLPQNTACQGTALFEREILNQKQKEQLRGSRMVLVPQSVSYLDSLMKVGEQARRGQKDKESVRRCHESLGRYGLGEDTEGPYPLEPSGGMTRRVLISTATMEYSRLIIADEPTPGLYIRVARCVLNHFREIADEGVGVPLITHDLELAPEVADRIVVFYAGTNVEEALAADPENEQRLRHPYTRAPPRVVPRHGFKAASEIQPHAADMPAGYPYGPRCPDMDEGCLQEISYRSFRGDMVRCKKAGVRDWKQRISRLNTIMGTGKY